MIHTNISDIIEPKVNEPIEDYRTIRAREKYSTQLTVIDYFPTLRSQDNQLHKPRDCNWSCCTAPRKLLNSLKWI